MSLNKGYVNSQEVELLKNDLGGLNDVYKDIAVAKQINIKIVVIAMHINVATRIVQTKNKIVLQAM